MITSTNMTDTGIVVIGRNEGERLERCLRSLDVADARVVYVDSGSTDDSVARAHDLGAHVVELSRTEPFTAAKARNFGLRWLLELEPNLTFVQFVDGDCQMSGGWLAYAHRVLVQQKEVAVVCGRRRERRKDATRYNRLCDMEWDVPPGDVQACGGDSMMRIVALREVGCFRSDMIAGEEPELCVRLRKRGWVVLRLDAEMTSHDAAMSRFSQWWRRSVRAGHAYAETAWLHGRTHRLALRRVASILFWSLLAPVAALAMAWPTRGGSLVILALLYAFQWTRIWFGQRRLKRPAGDASLYATFVLLGKFAECGGLFRFFWNKLRGRRGCIIEYKVPAHPSRTVNHPQ